MDVVHWHLQANSWPFKDGYKDSLNGAEYIKDIYLKAQPDYAGRFTVPVLWDKKTQTIGKVSPFSLFFLCEALSVRMFWLHNGNCFHPSAPSFDIYTNSEPCLSPTSLHDR